MADIEGKQGGLLASLLCAGALAAVLPVDPARGAEQASATTVEEATIAAIEMDLARIESERRLLAIGTAERLWYGGIDEQTQHRLYELMSFRVDDENAAVRKEAIRLSTALAPDERVHATLLLEYLQQEPDSTVRGAIVKALGANGLQTPEITADLFRIARRSVDWEGLHAMEALVAVAAPDPAALPLAMRYIESDIFLGWGKLVSNLDKFGQDAVPYLPRLEAVRDRLQAEENLPYDKRTARVVRDEHGINLYADSFSLPALDRLIAELRSGA